MTSAWMMTLKARWDGQARWSAASTARTSPGWFQKGVWRRVGSEEEAKMAMEAVKSKKLPGGPGPAHPGPAQLETTSQSYSPTGQRECPHRKLVAD